MQSFFNVQFTFFSEHKCSDKSDLPVTAIDLNGIKIMKKKIGGRVEAASWWEEWLSPVKAAYSGRISAETNEVGCFPLCLSAPIRIWIVR